MMKKLLLITFFVLPLLSFSQFVESFEGSTEIPAGWTVIDQGDAGTTWEIVDLSASELTAQTGVNIVSILYSATAHDDYLITPSVSVQAGVSDFLSFWARSRDPNYPETISLRVSTTGTAASDFTETLEANVAPASGPDFVKYQYELTDYVGQTIYIAFYSSTTDMFAFDLDEIEVRAIPTCYEPTAAAVDNLTTTTAAISWTGELGNYEVEYGAPGFTAGSGTPAPAVMNATSTTLSGLSSGTMYEYYVRQDCGSSDYSNWFGPIAFTTLCEAETTFPVQEGFESGSMPVCWENEDVSGGESWTFVSQNGNGSITPRTGTTMAEFRTGAYGDAAKLVSLPLDLSGATSPELDFYYANINWFDDIDELRVYYKTDANAAWTQIGEDYTEEQTDWTNVVLALPNPSATYYIAFEATSNWARGMNIDDVTVRLESLSVDSFDKAQLSIYPNPVKNTLNVSYSSQISSIVVYDLLGKVVLQSTPQSTSTKLDMSALATGSYIAKINSGTNTHTIKVLKE
ncbi:choice-of-anchor J domain-containing protein [Corallibacter sp.]|uniref:choice-of-anchor J domain-containing protein n=1 Tax=Corallibacter sp. TaxID=2038084 RepID=UPI003AB19C8C